MNNQTPTDSSQNLIFLGITFFTIGLILHGRLIDYGLITNLPGYINHLFMASGSFLILYSVIQLYLSKKGLDIDFENHYVALVFTTLFQTSMLLIFFAFIFMIFWLIFRNLGLFNASSLLELGPFDLNFYLIILLTLTITLLQNYIYLFSKR